MMNQMISRQLIYSKIQYNDVTICENDNSSVNSGTDGENSDIGVLTDFSDEDEDLIDRANRLYVECYNDDWCEGMTPITYTLPLRKNRRRRYEVRKKNETKIEESISVTSDWGFQTDEESPKSEPTVQPRTADDEDIPTVGRGSEVIMTFPVIQIRICSTDRSRSRRRHGLGGILMVQVENIGKISASR